MKIYNATDVFTPDTYPRYTYVKRSERRHEEQLRNAIETPGQIVSISGPSKSGKTVLVENTVGEDELIVITGAGIRDPSDLWNGILDWMELPESLSSSSAKGSSAEASGEVSAGLSFPGLGGIGTKSGVSGESSSSNASSEHRTRSGMQQVIKEIAGSDYVVLIDDYHYIDRRAQESVARELKEAARQGVKIVTASVPHRSDDVVRSNPELRGRVASIDLDYWSPDELAQIPKAGFSLMGASLESWAIDRYVRESSGSAVGEWLGMTQEDVDIVLGDTSTRADYASLVRGMHAGPKVRGQERKEYKFKDGTHGDVYRAILLALKADPPRLSITYNRLYQRLQVICKGDVPQAASICQACDQMSRIAHEMYSQQRVLEWDSAESLLDIVDPYLLYYLRWSSRLQSLAE